MAQSISLPTYYFGHVISVLKQSGIGIEKWLASQSLDLDKLVEEDARVSVQQFDGLIKTVIETRGFEDLGLTVGRRLEIAHHGDFGLAILNGANLRKVLDFHVKFLPIRVPLVQLNYRIEGAQVIVTLVDEHWQGSLHCAMIEAVMIAIVNMLHAIRFQDSEQLQINIVRFDYAAPNYAQKYNYIKADRLEFNHTDCSLRFSKSFLDKPLASADDFSFKRAVLNCEKELNFYLQAHLNAAEQVQTLLKQAHGINLNLEEVAVALKVSKRSLHRSLEKDGTSFKLLQQKVKSERAVLLLKQGMSVTEVADQLGYSDAANFRRAFKSWFGLAPKEWIDQDRKQNAAK